MLSKIEPDGFLEPSDEGMAGGPTQMVQRATYSETGFCCSFKAEPSGVHALSGYGVE